MPAALREERRAVAALARTFSELAIHQLVIIAANGQNEMARVKAAEVLLDRGFGKTAVPPDDPLEFGPRVIQFNMRNDGEILELEAVEEEPDV
jgi:hypothetical protein